MHMVFAQNKSLIPTQHCQYIRIASSKFYVRLKLTDCIQAPLQSTLQLVDDAKPTYDGIQTFDRSGSLPSLTLPIRLL
jgi:hypothetical protein